MDLDERPSTSGRAADAAAGKTGGAAAAAGAATSASTRKGRRRQSLSLDGPPKDDKWWLSEGEEESGDGEIDEDDGEGAKRRPAGEDEDPLYDPGADEEDEKWADEQRGGRPTDAILSCPGCFTTVCLECQQHEVKHTQYRAVFTVNCEVKLGSPMRVLTGPAGGRAGRKRKEPGGYGDGGGGGGGEDGGGEAEVMFPVCCEVCGTRVGAQDADEVVHFFHCLASDA